MKLLALLLLVSALTAASAQTGVGVSPPRVELRASVDATLTQEVQVDNPSGASPLEVTVTIEDALFQPDGSILYLPPGSHDNSVADWLAVSALQFQLEPRASEAVSYTVRVPPGTADGTYWAVLFFDSHAPVDADTPPADFAIRTRVRVGHIVYVSIGEIQREGVIEGVRYVPPASEPASIRVMVRNLGNGLLRLNGRVEVRDPMGELISTVEIEESAAFPGYAREIHALLPAPLERGEYVVLAVLDYGAASVIAGEAWIEVP